VRWPDSVRRLWSLGAVGIAGGRGFGRRRSAGGGGFRNWPPIGHRGLQKTVGQVPRQRTAVARRPVF
jgi:hypothetical protein